MPSLAPHKPSIHQGLFVTGTDTGVGKTTVTAAIALALKRQGINTGVMKPVETGLGTTRATYHSSDGQRLHNLITPNDPKELTMPYGFDSPLAPLEAARQNHSTIDCEVILQSYRTLALRHEFMLVEGAGGVLVPLSDQQDIRDLIRILQIPCLLVSQPILGAVNHTRLTLEALRIASITVRAIVLTETKPIGDLEHDKMQFDSTVKLIRQYSPVPVFGPLPFLMHLKQDWNPGVDTLSQTPAIHDLVQLLGPGM